MASSPLAEARPQGAEKLAVLTEPTAPQAARATFGISRARSASRWGRSCTSMCAARQSHLSR
eukprot:9477646-Pyramimonas_sp.AAC.1